MKKCAFNGVHPEDMKYLSSDVPVEALPVHEGDEFFLTLRQNIGAPSVPLVKKGQEVKQGELIAESGGFIGANLHSPVNGIVSAISKVDFPVYGTAECIVIKAGADQDSCLSLDSAQSLPDTVLNAGIVGMGGAMFPTHVKFSPKNQLNTLIINAAECEPYLTCDHRLMLEYPDKIIEGALLIKEALKLDRVIVGIEENKPDAVEVIKKKAGGRIDVMVLPAVYPQGGEKQLIKSVICQEVPEGKLPSDIGVLVDNVGTVAAVYDAVFNKKAFTGRIVTVTGDVMSPKNIFAPLGTPLSRLIDFCGGTKGDLRKVILGGPMTGFSAHSLSIPSYKGMNGVVIYAENKKADNAKVLPCIRCGRCMRACPSGLAPAMLENLYKADMYEELYDWKLLSCIECGACNYVCPSRRPLKTLFRLGKNEAKKAGERKVNE